MAHLGHMYANGIGVPASNASAIKWFRSGSERGNANAHFGLGYMYLNGQGLPQDYRLAVRYLTAAAEQVMAKSACSSSRNMSFVAVGRRVLRVGARKGAAVGHALPDVW